MSRPAKPTTCPLCHAVLGTKQPVYSTRTKETYQVKCWTTVGPVDTGKTDVRYLDWYACESCARKEHPGFFPTAESLKPLLDKMTANPDDWEASWNYKEAKERCYLEHRRCIWCKRSIYEKSGYKFAEWKRMGPACCSSNCTNARAYANRAKRIKLAREPKTTTCLTCQETFTPTRSDARFCSNACRQKHYRAKGSPCYG
jgi:hypothetical protein